MCRRLTTKECIVNFREVHGDRYDYSLVDYVHSKAKIEIICREHGEFMQSPNSHAQGVGCSKCAGVKSPTTEERIAGFRRVHGNMYDYSLVDYTNTKPKVRIICKEHGEFMQRASDHKLGNGCIKCTSRRIPTTEECVTEFRKIHGNTYDYSLVDYKGIMLKVKIICKEHGEFMQIANNHKQGKGCPKCSIHLIGDNNVLYIWEALHEHWNDKPIFKIGITSERLGVARIKQVAKDANLQYKIHTMLKTDNAKQVESELHSLFIDIPNMGNIDGKTEFRVVSYKDMKAEIEWLDVLYG